MCQPCVGFPFGMNSQWGNCAEHTWRREPLEKGRNWLVESHTSASTILTRNAKLAAHELFRIRADPGFVTNP